MVISQHVHRLEELVVLRQIIERARMIPNSASKLLFTACKLYNTELQTKLFELLEQSYDVASEFG